MVVNYRSLKMQINAEKYYLPLLVVGNFIVVSEANIPLDKFKVEFSLDEFEFRRGGRQRHRASSGG